MTAVVFDPAAFKDRYIEFNCVSDSALLACFNEAGLYLSNADNSPVQNIARRTLLLNMLTAHIAYIGGLTSADKQARPVGRVNSATEGTVSIGLEYGVPGTAAWFQQSQYGAAFWQATIALRSFRYIPRPTVY